MRLLAVMPSLALAPPSGNTYKDLVESTTMSSGLSFVLLANLVTASAGLLLYYTLVRRLTALTDDEIQLLRSFHPSYSPLAGPQQYYTPAVAESSRGPPPFRWAGWAEFLAAVTGAQPPRKVESGGSGGLLVERLSRDAQVYLLFLRMCMVVAVVCGAVAVAILVPVYVTAAGPDNAKKAPLHINPLAMTQSVFDKLTSQNLPRDSVWHLMQLPVWAVVLVMIAALYAAMITVNDKESSYDEWLRRPRRQELVAIARSRRSGRREKAEVPGWTIFARGIPDLVKTNDQLVAMLNTIYPGEVLRAELLFRGSLRHAKMETQLRRKMRQLEYLDTLSLNNFVRLRQRKFCLCIPTPTPTKQDLVRALERDITKDEQTLARARNNVTDGFLGCAFITFRSPGPAEACIRNFPHSTVSHGKQNGHTGSLVRRAIVKNFQRAYPFGRNGSASSISDIASESSEPENPVESISTMRAEIAPKAGDVVWSKIGMSMSERILRDIFVALLVFVLLILFTSPVAMLTGVRQVVTEAGALAGSIGPDSLFGWGGGSNGTEPAASAAAPDPDVAALSVSETLIDFLPEFVTKRSFARSFLLLYTPVLLLGLINSIVPSVLRFACIFEGYATRSERELSIFTKTVFYFIMNTIVLPSLALNTARELVEVLYIQSGGGENVNRALPIIERIFSGDISYFLCNFLVQLALTVNILWLLRVPGNVASSIRRWLATTPLELAQGKCAGAFDYPCHYAYCMVVLAMCLLLGVSAPVMWAFAAVFFSIKYFVDAYNIHYVHPRSHNDGRLARRVAEVIFFWSIACILGNAVVLYLRDFTKVALAVVGLIFLLVLTHSWITRVVGPPILRAVCAVLGRGIIDGSVDSPFYEYIDQDDYCNSSDSFSALDAHRDSRVILPRVPPLYQPIPTLSKESSDSGSEELNAILRDFSHGNGTTGDPSRHYGSVGLP